MAQTERETHTVKGAAANLGAEELRTVAFRLEKAAAAENMESAGRPMDMLDTLWTHLEKRMRDTLSGDFS